jgi:hypothetical protein
MPISSGPKKSKIIKEKKDSFISTPKGSAAFTDRGARTIQNLNFFNSAKYEKNVS